MQFASSHGPRSPSPLWVLLPALLAACAPEADPSVVAEPETTFEAPPETAPVEDTGYDPGDMGSLMLINHLATGRRAAFALFTQSNAGFPNLAQCAAIDVPCIPGLPQEEDSWVDIDQRKEFEPETVNTRFNGLEIGFGPYTLDYHNLVRDDLGVYGADISDQPWVNGWIGPSWSGGMWGTYEGTEDLYVSHPIRLQRPRPDEHIFFTNGTTIPIEWVPTGEGEVYLQVQQRFGISRLYHLKDDGYYELDVDELGFADLPEEMNFILSRWNRAQVRRHGDLLDLTAISDITFSGSYRNIGGREPWEPPDSCPEAQGSIPLVSGGYWGLLGNLDKDNAPSCGDSPSGQDALAKVVLNPRESLSVEFTMPEDDGVVYLLSDCMNDATCLLGENKAAEEEPEYLTTFNTTEDPQTVYLGMDSRSNSGVGLFTLDVVIDTLLVPDLYDSCAEAQTGVSLTDGVYYADFTAYSDLLNPGVGGCTGTSLPGADALAPITLQAGQTVQIGISMPGADPAIYLLYNCNDPFSAPVCADDGIGKREVLAYTNNSMGSENLFLVIDSKSGLQPFTLNVSIN